MSDASFADFDHPVPAPAGFVKSITPDDPELACRTVKVA